MKILQVMAGATHGGAETAFVDMCIALSDAGEQIEIVTRPNPLRVGRLEKAGITVHELRFGGMWDIYTTLRLKKIIGKFQPHIVQTWMSRASWKTPSWSKEDKIQRYFTVARLGGYYKLKYFKNMDYYTTITPDIRRYLVESGIPQERVFHINNFAEVEEVTRPVHRSDLDTPEDAIVLLALGRLHKAKGFDTLQQAVKNVPGVYLWIAGEGPDRAELEALCAELGLSDRVRFLGWRDDRAALFQSVDICVFSSRYEPFGTVFVQAWAQKVPLITTSAEGPLQYVKNGEDALMVPVDDVAALSNAIQCLVSDKELTAKLVYNGYQRYLEELTCEKTVRSYLTMYHGILEKHGLVATI
ncbi:MAG: glycosyl transferase [Alphaproteobacteria bacterium CG_4_9_14_3_um_filter_47_13]|nr:MAG: glycosyl transferase [Alphaproteobacteria bacterium CG_4_9_14_3_um_filter_47_13]